MISMKMPLVLHTAVKLIHKRYAKGEVKPKIADALLLYLREKDPELVKEAESAAVLREQLATMFGDDE